MEWLGNRWRMNLERRKSGSETCFEAFMKLLCVFGEKVNCCHFTKAHRRCTKRTVQALLNPLNKSNKIVRVRHAGEELATGNELQVSRRSKRRPQLELHWKNVNGFRTCTAQLNEVKILRQLLLEK